ncbi:OmpA family protein [Arcobacter cloacae]|uniref:Flagellar motor protein MotB n=1 Tax=Arcobacter cloacae TaxID=1054034 RepID=A0A4Q0ZH87_9BACT|nr:OmpA family protein [Arcobacter cloacae]RXJ85913.1 flagellar motor protein MotB [Arcobacter cloacae]
MKKILLTSLLCASSIFAASDPSKNYNYEVTPFTSGILTDSKVGLENDNYFNIGISLAKNLDDSFIDQLEIAYMRSENIGYEKTTGDTNINRTFLNAIKKFELTDRLAAYGLAGVGYQDVQELDKHQDSAIFNYGIGLRYDIPYYGIALKGDVRHLIAIKENQNDIMYTLGLGMPLGKKYKDDQITAKVPAVVAEPTKKIFEEKEEPLPIVNNDDDNDGVINSLDKCPNTSPGVKVNKDGCVNTMNLNINFDNNSAEIKSMYQNKLSQFANMLKDNKTMTAVIEAHTDSKGSDAYNQTLSDKRAISVVNALKSYGIESSRLRAIGYGETQPIATNETEEGKAQNRRVTALINQ